MLRVTNFVYLDDAYTFVEWYIACHRYFLAMAEFTETQLII